MLPNLSEESKAWSDSHAFGTLVDQASKTTKSQHGLLVAARLFYLDRIVHGKPIATTLLMRLSHRAKFLTIFEDPSVRCAVWHHTQARHPMLAEITLE